MNEENLEKEKQEIQSSEQVGWYSKQERYVQLMCIQEVLSEHQ